MRWLSTVRVLVGSQSQSIYVTDAVARIMGNKLQNAVHVSPNIVEIRGNPRMEVYGVLPDNPRYDRLLNAAFITQYWPMTYYKQIIVARAKIELSCELHYQSCAKVKNAIEEIIDDF